MRTIRNKTAKPIKIQFIGGKVLHLGPLKVAQVADNATEQAALRRLIESGEVEIVGEGERSDAGGEEPAARQETTHGHHPPTVVHRRGNR